MSSALANQPDEGTCYAHDLNESIIDHAEGQRFLNDAFKILVEEVLCKGTDGEQKVCQYEEPEALAQILDLELRETGEPHEKLLQRVKDVATYSVKTCHPRFFNQQYSGMDYHSLAGRFLSESLNTNLFTYEVAPVFVLMENEVLRALRLLVGWTEGDGLFCPGGSTSNMFAMNLARYQLFPEVKAKGMRTLPQLVVFTSPEVREHCTMIKNICDVLLTFKHYLTINISESLLCEKRSCLSGSGH